MEDALEVIIRKITADALAEITPEQFASVLTGRGAITTFTDGDGVVMRYVEPCERGATPSIDGTGWYVEGGFVSLSGPHPYGDPPA